MRPWLLFGFFIGFLVAVTVVGAEKPPRASAKALQAFYDTCARLFGALVPSRSERNLESPDSIETYHPEVESLIRSYRGRGIDLKPESLEKLDRARKVFDAAMEPNAKSPLPAIKTFLQDRTLVPENGVMHVVGPGEDYYEWIVPLLSRPDLKIIVSESNERFQKTLETPEKLRKVFDEIAKFNPEVIKDVTFESFAKQISERVWLIPDVSQKTFEPGQPGSIHPFNVSTPIPKGDVILAISPKDGGTHYSKQGKPGTVYWVLTEQYSPPGRHTLRLPPNRAMTFDLIKGEDWFTYHIGYPYLAIDGE